MITSSRFWTISVGKYCCELKSGTAAAWIFLGHSLQPMIWRTFENAASARKMRMWRCYGGLPVSKMRIRRPERRTQLGRYRDFLRGSRPG
jgi:hypothetical protein